MGKSASKEITAQDVEEAVKSTKYSKEEVEKWAQIFKKEFPNGKMTKKDCKRVIAKEFPMFNSEAVSDYLFKALDQDHSGSVDFREFVAAQSILNEGHPQDKLSFIFKMYDVDGNKFINQKELETIFAAIYKGAKVPDAAKKAKQEAADFIKQSDKDGDGKLTEQEFVQYLLPRVSGMLP